MKSPINPRHYSDGGVEMIEYLKAKLSPEEFRGFIKGNVLKYLSRERTKGRNTDLGKAAWYLIYYLGGASWCARYAATASASVKPRSHASRRPRSKLWRPKT